MTERKGLTAKCGITLVCQDKRVDERVLKDISSGMKGALPGTILFLNSIEAVNAFVFLEKSDFKKRSDPDFSLISH